MVEFQVSLFPCYCTGILNNMERNSKVKDKSKFLFRCILLVLLVQVTGGGIKETSLIHIYTYLQVLFHTVLSCT